MTLAAALAVGFALPAGNALAAKEDKAAADSNVIWVVDPSPVNWLWITWNTMEEHGPLLRLPGHQVSLSAHETKLAGRGSRCSKRLG